MANKFNTQICTTVEQSQRLLDLGLKSETADLHYCWQGGAWILYAQSWEDAVDDYPFDFFNEEEQYYWEDSHLPAWSLHRLLALYGAEHTFMALFESEGEAYDHLISSIEVAIKEEWFNKDFLTQ